MCIVIPTHVVSMERLETAMCCLSTMCPCSLHTSVVSCHVMVDTAVCSYFISWMVVNCLWFNSE
jgi:hypothetical protein